MSGRFRSEKHVVKRQEHSHSSPGKGLATPHSQQLPASHSPQPMTSSPFQPADLDLFPFTATTPASYLAEILCHTGASIQSQTASALHSHTVLGARCIPNYSLDSDFSKPGASSPRIVKVEFIVPIGPQSMARLWQRPDCELPGCLSQVCETYLLSPCVRSEFCCPPLPNSNTRLSSSFLNFSAIALRTRDCVR